MIWILSHPSPNINKILKFKPMLYDIQSARYLTVCRRPSLLTGEGRRGGGGGAKSYDSEKAWFSTKQLLILGNIFEQCKRREALKAEFYNKKLCDEFF